jgi:hypothetical protein
MSANLYPGAASLFLVLSRPYDLIRTTDVRDDLSGVKIWVSKTNNFNTATTTPYADGNAGLITQIRGLDEDTTYYVKYAFVSKIDPDTVTVSTQLTAKTLAAGVHVYGYLTNDPVGISTDASGSVSAGTNWQTVTTGTFKVYNDNTDVTGANDSTLGVGNPGPVYRIKTGSTLGGLTAVINSISGVYYATGMTDDNGSVVFEAVYNGVTIERVWSVYKGKAGQLAPIITLTTNVKEFVYKDVNATTSLTTSATIQARLTNLTAQPTFTIDFYTRANEFIASGVLNTDFTISSTAPYTLTITGTQFSNKGITVGYAIVTATIGTVFDKLTLYRLNDGTDQITVEQSNPVHTLSAAANGDTVLANYVGSGNTITVKKGITPLLVDNSSPYPPNTWRVESIDDTHNIAVDQYPEVGTDFIRYDPMAAMTADDAYIDYTIRVQKIQGDGSSSSQYQDYKVRQSFAKSKQGIQGSTARTVNLTAPRQAFVTAKNSTTPVPSTILLTATQSNFVSPVYTWLIDGQVPGTLGTVSGNTLTLNSFASGNAKTIKVTVAESTGGNYSAFDEYSVYSLKEGDDSLAAGLSNENQTISCDSLGNVKTGQLPLTSTLQVVQGVNLLNGTTTPAATFSKVIEYGMTSSINASTGVVTVTALTTEFANAQYRVTVGNVILDKVLTLNKSIEGSDAPTVNLSTTSQLFIAAKNSGVISPTSVTFTASAYNLGNSPSVVWKIDGVTQTGQTGYTLSVSSFATGTKIVRVEITGNGTTVFDQVTLYALKEGDDSIAAGLVNENQTITCDNTGHIIGGQLPLASSLGSARGAAMLVYPQVSFSKVSENGLTATIDEQTGVIAITAITAADNVYAMSATFRATVGSVTVDRILTINKSLNGKTPIKGTDYVDGKSTYTATVYRQLASAPLSAPTGGSYNFTTNYLTEPADWSKTLPTTSATLTTYASQYTFVTTVPGDTITATTWATPVAYVKNGAPGEPGTPGTPGAASTVPGPRTASGYLYYTTVQAGAPSAPTGGTINKSNTTTGLGAYIFNTGLFYTMGSWSGSVPDPSTLATDTTKKAWATRYSVIEVDYDSTTQTYTNQTITYSSPFASISFNGLVTFSNNSYVDTTSAGDIAATKATAAVNAAASNYQPAGSYANTTLSNVTTIDGAKVVSGNSSNGILINGLTNKIEVFSGGVRRVVIGNLG